MSITWVYRGTTFRSTSPSETAPGPRSPALPIPATTWMFTYRWGVAGVDLIISAAVIAAATAPAFNLATMLLAVGGAGLLVFLVGVFHGYDSRRAAVGTHEYGAIARGGWVWASLLILGCYLVDTGLPPVLVCVSIALAPAAVGANRTLVRHFVSRQRRHFKLMRRTLLVGDPGQTGRMATLFREHPEHGLDAVGACLRDGDARHSALPVLGEPADVCQVVEDEAIEVVIITTSCMDRRALRHLSWRLEKFGVELLLAPDVEDLAAGRVAVQPVAGTPLVTIALGPTRVQLVTKSIIDRLLGMLLLTVLLLPLAAAAAAVRLTSRGPAFFSQERIGQDGATFTILKLRTMTDAPAPARGAPSDARDLAGGAEQGIAEHDGNAVMFKLRADPRVTPVGRFLRRFSLDELPQLINVVRGDMSLVGPRPPLPEEVTHYDFHASRRLRVKPGMTGLWQVSGRSDLDWDLTVRLDLDYVDNWSLLMDGAILARTFRAVFGGRGAY